MSDEPRPSAPAVEGGAGEGGAGHSGPRRYRIVTLFPEMFSSVLQSSLLARAVERGIVSVDFDNPRDYSPGPGEPGRGRVDDAPYGGGSGMVMRVDYVAAAIEAAGRRLSPTGATRRILLSPTGKRLDQATVLRLAEEPALILVCGRYEGIDDRVRAFIDEEISLGDFVLTGGELPAMALIDAVARRLPGVLGNESSALEESFEDGLLEHPQYTRPPEFRGAPVPEVLLSGDHQKVRKWRRAQSLRLTRERRPDLFAAITLSDEDRELLSGEPRKSSARAPAPTRPTAAASPSTATTISSTAATSPSTATPVSPPATPGVSSVAARTFTALVHHPVYGRRREIITTAITNLDVHDLSRSTRTYGLAGFFLVTPIESQRELATHVLDGWRGTAGEARNVSRSEALSTTQVVASIEEARAAVEAATGRPPLVIGTSARPGGPVTTPAQLLADPAVAERPLLILFGTGWGLADQAMDRVDRLLPPIQGSAAYNHLSVRSAAAIVLDRLFGDR